MKKMYRILVLSIFTILFVASKTNAQNPIPPNCPLSSASSFVQINGSGTSTCGGSVVLSAVGVSNVGSTDSYSVTQVPYAAFPYVGANTPLTDVGLGPVPITDQDDVWGFPTPLPFSFCFFGNKYDSAIIGSNGNLSFDFINNTAGFGNQYNFQTVTMPNNNTTWNNSICGPHSDIHPQSNTGCNITWDVYGTAPCRAFVASWDSVGYFPVTTCGFARTTQQIILYENTNIIDNCIKFKQLCSSNSSNGATAHQGIQNAAGTVAFVVPGHNGGQWTDSQSTWRYTPVGAQTFTYTWYNASTGAQIGTGSSISVSPITTTQYAVVASMGCSNLLMYDTFQVTVNNAPVADFNAMIELGCVDDTIKFTNASAFANNYAWAFGDGQFSLTANPTHIYTTQNIYTVTLIANDGPCRDTIKKVYDLRHPIDAVILSFDSFCLANPVAGVPITITNASIGGGLISTFIISDGKVVVKNNLLPVLDTFYTAGIYNIFLKVVDTLGCVDSTNKNIYVDNTPYADFTLTKDNICIGDPIFIKDTIPPFAQSFTYDFGDTYTLTNYHNPQHTYDNFASSNPTITLTTKFLVCPDYVVSKPVTIHQYPTLSLGKDTVFCPGYTSAYSITANGTNGNSYLWQDGSTQSYFNVTQPGTYWVTAYNTPDCFASDTVVVGRDCYINIPNSFTPAGGDELNKYFMAQDPMFSGATSFKMDIFNRWGENVFTTTNLNSRGWDGKFGGKDQPIGTYVYQINVVFKNAERKTYTGNVTLLR